MISTKIEESRPKRGCACGVVIVNIFLTGVIKTGENGRKKLFRKFVHGNVCTPVSHFLKVNISHELYES